MPRGVPAARMAEKEAQRLKMVAACKMVEPEIRNEFTELKDDSRNLEVRPLQVDLVCEVKTTSGPEYRKLNFTRGHKLFWEGDIRTSPTGKLIFIFKPKMTDMLISRQVKSVEIPHSDLKKVAGQDFVDFLHSRLSDNLDDLINVALNGVAEVDMIEAKSVVDPVIKVDMQSKISNWGVWA